MYVWDIVKDTAQLLLMVIVVGGYKNVFENWSFFSSVVSHIQQDTFQKLTTFLSFQIIWCTFLSIVVPMMLGGTIRMGKVKVGTFVIDILTAIIRPVILQYQLQVSKFMRNRILKQTDIGLASSLEKICAPMVGR